MKHFKFNIDEILQPQDWGFPVPIAYGPGRIKEISTFCKNLNIQNPLIVTDSGSKDLSFIENLKKILTDANMEFDNTGKKIVAMDASHTVLVNLNKPPDIVALSKSSVSVKNCPISNPPANSSSP